LHQNAVETSAIVMGKLADSAESTLAEKGESLLVGLGHLELDRAAGPSFGLLNEMVKKLPTDALVSYARPHSDTIEVSDGSEPGRPNRASNITGNIRVVDGNEKNRLLVSKIILKVQLVEFVGLVVMSGEAFLLQCHQVVDVAVAGLPDL
jgi:hypothetical protein